MDSKTLLQNNPTFAHRPIQLVLVRANGPLFYAAAAASLLEALVPVYAQRMRTVFRGDRDFCEWIENEWLPRKAARAAALRQYVEKTWPEFDWAGCYEQCLCSVRAEGGMGPLKPTPAHEALARCVAAAESGVFYRSLARWADDPRLRELAAAMADEEALSFDRFRAAYERSARAQRLGLISAWRSVAAAIRTARDLHVPLAFRAIGAHCQKHVPFPVLDYSDFLGRMRSVIGRHGNLSVLERILFHPWKGRVRTVGAEEPKERTSVCFKPLLKAA